MKSPHKISRNDPALAHAMARHALARAEVTVSAAWRQAQERHQHDMKGAFRLLARAFGDLVLEERIERPNGSRAKGLLVALDVCPAAPELMVLAGFPFDARRGGLQVPQGYALRVNLHVLARLMQRSLGVADIQAAARLIGGHLMVASHVHHWLLTQQQELEPLPLGTELVIVSPTGALCFTTEPGALAPYLLLARTWISRDAAVIPRLLRAFEQAQAIDGFTLLIGDDARVLTVPKAFQPLTPE